MTAAYPNILFRGLDDEARSKIKKERKKSSSAIPLRNNSVQI